MLVFQSQRHSVGRRTSGFDCTSQTISTWALEMLKFSASLSGTFIAPRCFCRVEVLMR